MAGTVTANARSSTWIAVDAPFTGDTNRNGYTVYELGTSSSGPFDSSAALFPNLPGPPEWRANVFSNGVMPHTTYYVRVTFIDPDGVSGINPQIVGPITTPASAPDAVTVGTATAIARDTEIYVSTPIQDDANRNSGGAIEIATSAAGPWTRKCGSLSEINLPFHPKRGRIRGLIPGTDYYLRVTITDPDGVNGTNPQIIGPIRYIGMQDLALGKTISADPGWGCCPSPSQLVDGRIQNDNFGAGFAWTGGTSCWAGGCPPGFKQATIDLGAPTRFNRAIAWYHDPGNVPTSWKFQYSNDGVNFTDAYANTAPICRTSTIQMPGAWYYPACGHDATFPPVMARYLRYTFDDTTLFGGIHGWAVELEVFSSFIVTNTNDSGTGSLRQAITDANGSAGPNIISFNIPATDPGFSGSVFTIKPSSSALPTILNNTTIDGTTQTTFTGDTNANGPEIVLNGSLLSSGNGLTISGDGNTVKSLVINGFNSGAGIAVTYIVDLTPSNNRILNNYIGTDASGTSAVPNSSGTGINGFGSPSLQAQNNVVQNNLISGNSDGIGLCDAAQTSITNNLIGTDRTGTASLGNNGIGINIGCAGAPNNLIMNNTIAFNNGDGIRDLPDYRFGVSFTASGHQGNRFTQNSIFSNSGLGINLNPPPSGTVDGVTPNDNCDSDSGANLLQNFPVITSAITNAGTTIIQGMLNSTTSTTFTLEFFSNTAVDATSYGEGQTYLGSTSVTTGPGCTTTFTFIPASPVAIGKYISATATDPANNTSEFAQNRVVLAPTAAPASLSGQVLTTDGQPLGGVTLLLMGGLGLRHAITDASGRFIFAGLVTSDFYTLAPARANYRFSPALRTFSLLSDATDAAFTALPEAATGNPLDTQEFFVRQQYLDFLDREPETAGLEYWSEQISKCGNNAECVKRRRIDVATAFFAEREFQQTGSYVCGLYKASFGRRPTFAEFMSDRAVGGGDDLDARKASLAQEFVQRAEFARKFPASMSGTEFIDTLLKTVLDNSGVDLSGQRNALIEDYRTFASRSRILKMIAESQPFVQAEYNRAFVLAEYFGFLRRDPEPAGYDFWLDVLDHRVPGDYRAMVCAFLTSAEYQHRFSPIATRANSECGP